MTERVKVELTSEETRRLERLRPTVGVAWQFWEDVAKERGLDFQSLVVEMKYLGKGETAIESITALPLGHGKDWCYPFDIKSKHDGLEIYYELKSKGEIN